MTASQKVAQNALRSRLFFEAGLLISKHEARLKRIPHPHPYLRGLGKTLFDFAKYVHKPYEQTDVLLKLIHTIREVSR